MDIEDKLYHRCDLQYHGDSMIFFKKLVFKLLKPFVKLFSQRDYWEENIFQVKRKIFGDEFVIADSGMNYIDKKYMDECIAALGDTEGVAQRKSGGSDLIVSLTTYPARIKDVRYTLYSLLVQTVKPSRIIVWLAEEEFPHKQEPLSEEFARYGVTIEFCSNIRSYKKLIPTLEKFPDATIVTADDDIYYEPDWLEKLYLAYKKRPDYIHCHRIHKVRFDEKGEMMPYRKWKSHFNGGEVEPSFLNLFIGCGGVLYPPNALYQDVNNKELFTKLAPIGDDIWFWAMAVLQETKINLVENNITEMTYVDPKKELGIDGTPLWRLNVGRRLNDRQLGAVVRHYDMTARLVSDEICT